MTDMQRKLTDLKRLDYLLRFSWRCHAPNALGLCPAEGEPHDGHPYPHGRPDQLPPDEYYIWVICAGRGFGKTRTGAETTKEHAFEFEGARIGLVAPTFADGRDVMFEGESGLRGQFDGQGVIPWEYIETYNRSMGEMYLKNGAYFKLYSAEDISTADRLRGKQFSMLWFDELAAMGTAGEYAWDMGLMGLRLGSQPRAIVTTTPRPTKFIKSLVFDPEAVVTYGSTFANAKNLPAKTVEKLKKRYDGTRLAEQELFGKILLEAQGAIWTLTDIRRQPAPTEFARVVTAVDPAGSHKEDSDLTGIVTAGIDDNNFGWVISDRSGKYAPEEWARIVNEEYTLHGSDCVVAETNYGGQMVKSNLRSANFTLPIHLVHTRVGKKRRAEPVQHLYARKLIFHSAEFSELEEQMTTWVPKGRFDSDGEPIPPSTYSPDRMDAMVYALSELFLNPQKQRGGMRFYG